MEILSGITHNLVWFLVVLTIVVYFHELGHYSVARLCGVRVETFSIGFGREILGYTAKSGTRWKVGIIPLGGYVKFFGDAGPVSNKDFDADHNMSAEDRKVSFHYKSLKQKSAIVAAGPMANFLLAVVILSTIFITFGRPHTPPIIGSVMADSAAAKSGLRVGDRIVQIDQRSIKRFEEIRDIVLFRPGERLELLIVRAGETLEIHATPSVSEVTDNLGNTHRVGLLGIGVSGREYRKLGIGSAVVASITETYFLVQRTMEGLGQIIAGTRSAKELGGPVLIAQMSGQQAANGPLSFFNFVVILSVTLGLINLFPIPVLDGGHLLFFGIEAIRGRPLGERAQEYGYFAGLVFIVSLMVLTTVNDLSRPAVADFFARLVG